MEPAPLPIAPAPADPPAAGRRPPLRTVAVRGLTGALLLAAGFGTGLLADHGGSGTAAASGRAPTTGRGDSPPGVTARSTRTTRPRSAAAGSVTSGTVASVGTSASGKVVRVRLASGKVVSVDVTDKTAVTVTRTGSLAALHQGARVVVSGRTGSSGTITATVIAEGTSAATHLPDPPVQAAMPAPSGRRGQAPPGAPTSG